MAAPKKAMTIKEVYEKYKEGESGKKELKLREISNFSFRTDGNSQYDIISLIGKSNTNHRHIYKHYCKPENLESGYTMAGGLLQAANTAKSEQDDYLFAPLHIGGKDILIVKRFNASEEIKPDMITPTRFSYVLTLSAIKVFDILTSTNDMTGMLKLYHNVINPIAMAHGFFPKEEPKFPNDTNWKMMGYYLAMTAGFDSLVCVRPTMAAAIVAYRGYGKNPQTLGLTSGLGMEAKEFVDGEAYQGNNHELKSRIAQGIHTKVFQWGGKVVKMEQLTENERFTAAAGYEFFFLVENAAPTKNKVKRLDKIFEKIIVSIVKKGKTATPAAKSIENAIKGEKRRELEEDDVSMYIEPKKAIKDGEMYAENGLYEKALEAIIAGKEYLKLEVEKKKELLRLAMKDKESNEKDQTVKELKLSIETLKKDQEEYESQVKERKEGYEASLRAEYEASEAKLAKETKEKKEEKKDEVKELKKGNNKGGKGEEGNKTGKVDDDILSGEKELKTADIRLLLKNPKSKIDNYNILIKAMKENEVENIPDSIKGDLNEGRAELKKRITQIKVIVEAIAEKVEGEFDKLSAPYEEIKMVEIIGLIKRILHPIFKKNESFLSKMFNVVELLPNYVFLKDDMKLMVWGYARNMVIARIKGLAGPIMSGIMGIGVARLEKIYEKQNKDYGEVIKDQLRKHKDVEEEAPRDGTDGQLDIDEHDRSTPIGPTEDEKEGLNNTENTDSTTPGTPKENESDGEEEEDDGLDQFMDEINSEKQKNEESETKGGGSNSSSVSIPTQKL